MRYNLCLDVDAYKPSQYLQYPPGTQRIFSYAESRGGYSDKTVFFGLQYLLENYLSKPITQEDIDEAEQILAVEGGLSFNKEGWQYILSEHKGYLPVRIFAVPEGSVIPVSNALLSINNTDDKCFWLSSYIETLLMRAVWYGTTVATYSWNIKRKIKSAFDVSASVESMPSIDFRLCDFGSRGVSSYESSMVGGAAHLSVFDSTDNVSAVRFAKHYYKNTKQIKFVSASEHSTITSWGKEHEVDSYRNMIKQFGRSGSIFACVSDSYDIYNAVEHIWGEELKQEVIDSGASLIIRPDSGKPSEVVLRCLELLSEKFGYTLNEKGYKVIAHNVRIIQGDGVNLESISEILGTIIKAGFSVENVFFGMGGALLQHCNRDTHEFAIKCSAAEIRGVVTDVYKDPVTSSMKKSKRGIISLYKNDITGEYVTRKCNDPIDRFKYSDALELVYQNGKIMKTYTMEEIRENINKN